MSLLSKEIRAQFDPSVELFISGFIRKQKYQKRIPEELTLLILAFYFEREQFGTHSDYFSVEGIKRDIIISEDEEDCYHIGYGTVIIDMTKETNIIYEWTLKIVQLSDAAAIGICTLYDALDTYLFVKGVFSESSCYGLHCDGSKHAPHERLRDDTGLDYGTGDIIILKLNTKDKSVSFEKSDQDQVVLFEDIDIRDDYHIAVCLGSFEDSMQILGFKTYAVE